MYNIEGENLEYLLFFVIVILQIWFFRKTRLAIRDFKVAIPAVNDVHIATTKLTEAELERLFSSNALSVKPWHTAWKNPDKSVEENEQLVKIKVVTCTNNKSTVFTNIIDSLNKYLICNRHSVADFELIKDIVERNTNTLEDEVNLTLSTPLYLGLMGTMMGIVIGLFSMSHLMNISVSDKDLSVGIAILLGSVKIAMIGSFVGLAFTIINSAVVFKGTKYKVEARKNAFYTFIQVSLLPTLNTGMGSTLESLQRNLFAFNEAFGRNLGTLSGVFDKNYEAIKLNKELIDQLNSNKVAEITEYNVRVLKELKIAVGQFEKFNTLFGNVDEYIQETYKLTDKTTELLQRTDNFETIADKIVETVGRNQELFQFLQNHFAELKDFKEKVTATVATVSFGITDAFKQMNKEMVDKSKELSVEAALRNEDSRKVFAEFTKDLKTSFEEQTASYRVAVEKQAESFRLAVEEKKSNLDYLGNLGPLLTEVKSLKNAGGNYNTDKLLSQLNELNHMLKWVEEDINTPILKKLFTKRRHERKHERRQIE